MSDGLGNKAAIQDLIQTEVSKMFAKFKTDEGGFYVEMYAAEDITRGEVVKLKPAGTSKQVIRNTVDSDKPIGVAYNTAIVGEIVKVVVSGTAYVLPEAAVTATIDYIIYSSNSEIGRVDQSNAVPAVAEHNREVGHFAESGSGAGALALAILHFN